MTYKEFYEQVGGMDADFYFEQNSDSLVVRFLNAETVCTINLNRENSGQVFGPKFALSSDWGKAVKLAYELAATPIDERGPLKVKVYKIFSLSGEQLSVKTHVRNYSDLRPGPVSSQSLRFYLCGTGEKTAYTEDELEDFAKKGAFNGVVYKLVEV